MTDALWVVGDTYPTPGLHPEVRTLGDVLRAVRTRNLGRVHLAPALGVSPHDWDFLADEVARARLVGSVRLAPAPPRPVSRTEVLKSVQENVVVAEPRVRGAATVECALVIAEGNEIMRDHTTQRQHLPGMLLIEAAIQAVTWATRALYPAERGELPAYPVMHGCGFEFQRFLFWLPVTVSVTLTEIAPADAVRRPLSAEIAYLQQGRICARGHFGFHAFNVESVHDAELGQSRTVILPPPRGLRRVPREEV